MKTHTHTIYWKRRRKRTVRENRKRHYFWYWEGKGQWASYFYRYTMCGACVERERFEISEKFLWLLLRCCRKGKWFSTWSVPNYWPIELDMRLAHARNVQRMKFHENPFPTEADIQPNRSFVMKVKLHSTITRSQPQTYTPFVAHA